MEYRLPNGDVVSAEQPFEIAEQQYPPYWLAQATPPELEALGVTLVEPTVQQRLRQYEIDLDTFLDAKAQEYTFKDRHSLALRGGYPNKWRALGEAFGTWMDDCNDRAWLGMQEILAGIRPMPENKEAFLAELPEFTPPSAG